MKPHREKFGSAWYRGPGLIYFLAAGKPPIAIKIGVAKLDGMFLGLLRRMRGIQSSNHELIELLGVICFKKQNKDDKPLLRAERREQELHRQFASLQRLKDDHVGHEWFTVRPESELVAFIKDPKNMVDTPEKLGLKPHVSVRSDSCAVHLKPSG